MSNQFEVSPINKLETIYRRTKDIIREKNLKYRVKNPANLSTKNEQHREKMKHGKVNKYEIERFLADCERNLKTFNKYEELIEQFEDIDFEGNPVTNANFLDYKNQKLLQIIYLIKENPRRYSLDDINGYKNVMLNIKDKIILQGANRQYPLEEKAWSIIRYLFGKKHEEYRDKSKARDGRPIRKRSVINNCRINTEVDLKNVIDNFNRECRRKHIQAFIKVENDMVQLRIKSDFPAVNYK